MVEVARPVRLVDIAQKAGVSRITVAKVLHDGGGKNTRVSDDTAKKVREIASQLDYRPNMAARQLKGASSKLIGVIIDSFAADAGRSMLMTIERMVAQHGYRLLVGFMHDDFDRIQNYIDDFLGRGVDGIISMAHTYPEFGDKVPSLYAPFKNCVFIEKPLRETPFSSVDVNNEYAGYILTEHLLKLGRKRIAVSSLELRYEVIVNREKGYERCYKEMGVEFDPSLISRGTDTYIQSLEIANKCLDKILKTNPDAIIVGSDEVAIWFIEALQDRGIRVPEDIAIASFTHMQSCRGFRPTLTTLNMVYQEVAMTSINLLFDNIKNKSKKLPEKQDILLKPKLIVGSSCGAKL